MNGIIEIILALLALVNSQGNQTDTYEVPAPPTPAYQAEVVVPDLCDGLTVTIDWNTYPGSPLMGSREYRNVEPWEIRADVVGDFLWLQFDHRVADSWNDVTSVELTPGTSEVVVCKAK